MSQGPALAPTLWSSHITVVAVPQKGCGPRMGTTPAPPHQQQQDTPLSPCPAQRGPMEDMESRGWGRGWAVSTRMSPACAVPATVPLPRPGPAGTSHFPGRSSPARGGRGERALRSFCFANRKPPRGEKANSVSLGSAVSHYRLMRGEAGGRTGAPRRRQQRGRGRVKDQRRGQAADHSRANGLGPFLASLSPPGSLSLGSCLSFHLPLIPLEAGLTQEPPKQGPDQCHTPARIPLTVATWGFATLAPGLSHRRQHSGIQGQSERCCHPSSQSPAARAGRARAPGIRKWDVGGAKREKQHFRP